MPAPKCDGGKDSGHGGKERVIQAAKPLGTGGRVTVCGSFAGVLIQSAMAVGSVYDGGGHMRIKTYIIEGNIEIKTYITA